VAHPKRVEAEPRLGASYDGDLAAWSLEQAGHLRQRAWAKLDIPHLIDEVESVARAERNALTSALRIILLHLLKWDHQPDMRSRSWTTSIRVQRLAALERMEDSPSLGAQMEDLLARAYRRARIEAAAETNLPEATFPETCPYSADAVLNRDMPWPQAANEKAGISSEP
jgi:predicted DNA-binding ribbon-helix-helix protein